MDNNQSRPSRMAKSGAIEQLAAMHITDTGYAYHQPGFHEPNRSQNAFASPAPSQSSNNNMLSPPGEDEMSSVSDSDFENFVGGTRPKKRRGELIEGTAGKRGRGRGSSRGRGRCGVPRPSTSGAGANADPALEQTDETTLFGIIKAGKAALRVVVDDWIDEYKNDRDDALLVLCQFFIDSSGCKGKITRQMLIGGDYTQIIRKLTEEFDEDSGEYPLIMPGHPWKKFKNNLGDFVIVSEVLPRPEPRA